eukprot:scaffold6811_cov55-Phaeocystis_antarctica.AAC.6
MGVDKGLSSRTGRVLERNARQVGDVRLFEDGGELGGALDSDLVEPQTVSEEQSGDGKRTGVSTGADTKANGHADDLLLQVELRDAVLTQRGERDPAEVGHNGVLQHHRGQTVGGVARDGVIANAVITQQWYERHTGRGCIAGSERGCRGGGALEVGDLRLVEDGCERGGALDSDVVASETASEEQDGKR